MIRSIVATAILLCCASCSPGENAATNQAEECTRAVLQTAVDSYLAAQEAGDPSKMLLASEAQYIECKVWEKSTYQTTN